MEKAEILKRAQDYIAAEKDERFRKEVEDLVAKEDFKEPSFWIAIHASPFAPYVFANSTSASIFFLGRVP